MIESRKLLKKGLTVRSTNSLVTLTHIGKTWVVYHTHGDKNQEGTRRLSHVLMNYSLVEEINEPN